MLIDCGIWVIAGFEPSNPRDDGLTGALGPVTLPLKSRFSLKLLRIAFFTDTLTGKNVRIGYPEICFSQSVSEKCDPKKLQGKTCFL